MINYLIHIFKFKSKTLKIYIKNNIKYYYITLIIEQKLSQFDLKKKVVTLWEMVVKSTKHCFLYVEGMHGWHL